MLLEKGEICSNLLTYATRNPKPLVPLRLFAAPGRDSKSRLLRPARSVLQTFTSFKTSLEQRFALDCAGVKGVWLRVKGADDYCPNKKGCHILFGMRMGKVRLRKNSCCSYFVMSPELIWSIFRWSRVFQKGTENGHRSHERHEMATCVRNHETWIHDLWMMNIMMIKTSIFNIIKVRV